LKVFSGTQFLERTAFLFVNPEVRTGIRDKAHLPEADGENLLIFVQLQIVK
jgi:hypothetical protein